MTYSAHTQRHASEFPAPNIAAARLHALIVHNVGRRVLEPFLQCARNLIVQIIIQGNFVSDIYIHIHTGMTELDIILLGNDRQSQYRIIINIAQR